MLDDGMRYVICYDIPDDKRRTRLFKILDSFGDRIQFSVFEAFLTAELFEKLIVKINDCIDSEEDLVVIYPLCAACAKKIRELGRKSADLRPGEEIVFVV